MSKTTSATGVGTSTTSYKYDGVDQVVEEDDPTFSSRLGLPSHSPVTRTTFDADGNVTVQTVSDGSGNDAARTTSTTYDSRGRTQTTIDAAGGVTGYTYDAYGNVATQTDPSGSVTAYTYDTEGRLLTTTLKGYTGDPAAPTAAVDLVESSRAYDPAGRLASITDAMGRLTSYTYTGDGLVASVVRSFGGSSSVVSARSYDAVGNVLSEVSHNGVTTTTYDLDAAGRVATETLDPAGLARRTSYTYNPDDAVTRTVRTDASGASQTVTAAYDAMGRLTSRTLTGSVAPTRQLTTSWALDARGLPTSETDPAGNVTTYQYDELGQLVLTQSPQVTAETYGAGAATAWPVVRASYDTFGEQIGVMDANNRVSRTEYDALGRVVKQTSPAYTPPGGGAAVTPVVTRTYDAVGQLITETDPLGKQTVWSYDQLGDVATETAPDGGVTHYTYDADGETLSVTDPTGAQTQATYDFLGRPVTSSRIVRQPSQAVYTTTTGYDTGGWTGSVTSPAGVVTAYTHDAAGETTKVVDGAGNPSTYSYDFLGRRTGATLPDSTRSTTSYDDNGNPVAVRDLDASGAVLRTRTATFDLVDQLTASTDARGNTTTFSYDALGQITGEVQPIATGSSITTSFGYDAAGNRTRFTDGRGNQFWTTYNTWNLPESQIEPATTAFPAAADRTFTATYDAGGQLVGVLQPGGVTVANTYDAVGNLTGSTGSGGEASTTARTFGYDKDGQLVSASAPGGTDTFGYDDRGLLLSTGGPSGTSSFGYTADGLMSSRTDASGTTAYTYDTADRLSTMTDPLTGTKQTYSYNTLSLPTKVTYGTGNVRSFGYDGLHRLTSDALKTSGGAAITSIAYGYDANDNLTTKTTSGVAGAGSHAYTYDAANRLTSWNNGTSTVTYGYDASGNRTQIGSRTATFDARNQLLNDGTRTYTYSARGTQASIVSGSGTQLTAFDAFGQAINQSGRTYAYDALGRMLTASGGAGASTLVYSGAGNDVASDGGATYARDPDSGLLAVGTSAGNVLAFTDQHDDVVGQFTATGTALTGSTSYDPFGTVTASTGLKGSLGFQSGWTDPNTSRVNMASRWYDPSTGGFISRDATNLDAVPTSVSANRFAYVNDNPLAGTDPTGMCSWYDIACGVTHVAKQVTSAVSSAWHSSGISQYGSYAAHYAMQTYHAAKAEVHRQVARAVHAVKKVVHKVNDAYHSVKHRAEIRIHKIHQALNKVVKAVKHYTKTGLHALSTAVHHPLSTIHKAHQMLDRNVSRGLAAAGRGLRVAGRIGGHIAASQARDLGHLGGMIGRGVADGATATAKFAQHHAADIAAFAVSTVVFIGCEAAVTAVSGGALAAPGVIGCSALAGAAGNAVSYSITAAQNGNFSLTELAKTSAEGAVIGAATAGLTLGGSALLSRVGGKAVQAVTEAAEGAETAAASNTENKVTACVIGVATAHSFSATTPVVMADGSRKAIAKIKVGEKVLATDVKTGRNTVRAVLAVMVHRDHDAYDLKVRTPSGTGIVHTTAGHPIWVDATRTWTRAGDLAAGTRFHTADGQAVTLTAGTQAGAADADMWDLTVKVDHDFYVEIAPAAGTLLVHNTNGVGAACGSAKPVVGFAEGLGETALPATRVQHAGRHLEERGLLPTWSGKTGPAAVRDALVPILENPSATFDHVLKGGQPVKGFVGQVAGVDVAVMVFKEGKYAGQVATSDTISAMQRLNWGLG